MISAWKFDPVKSITVAVSAYRLPLDPDVHERKDFRGFAVGHPSVNHAILAE
jgi:hypothetical protein